MRPRKTILCVEDNEQVLSVRKFLLETRGYRVLAMSTAAEALEHLQAYFPDTLVGYWRDKGGHEIDFIMAHRRDAVDAIECKWNPSAFDGSSLKVFRSQYPQGRNYLVTPSGDPSYTRIYQEMEVRVCTPSELL